MYFGKPKRIWRGKVLKSITTNTRLTAEDLIDLHAQLTTQHSTEFEAFITGIANELVREGLCSKQGKYFVR